MSTYTEQGDQVRLEMSRSEYSTLVFALGMAAGASRKDGDNRIFWNLIDLMNRINAGNPHFTPYEIPEEFRSAPA